MTNVIHPTAVIENNVQLGKNNYIGPFCRISGLTEIGDNNYFDSFVSIGSPPQDDLFDTNSHTKFRQGLNPFSGQANRIKIGSNNVFREYVSVHSPTLNETSIGNNCYFMVHSHIPHDAIIKDRVKFANSCNVGGFSIVLSDAYLGLATTVLQFTVIGSMTMVAMNSSVSRSIYPGSLVAGSPAKTVGPNKVKLIRHFETYDWWTSEREKTGTNEAPTAFVSIVEEYEQMKILNQIRKSEFYSIRETFKNS